MSARIPTLNSPLSVVRDQNSSSRVPALFNFGCFEISITQSFTPVLLKSFEIHPLVAGA